MAKHTLSSDHSLRQRNFPCLMPPVMLPPYHACDRCMTWCPHFSLSSSHHLPPPSTQLSGVSVPANTPRRRLLYATSPAPEHPACIPNHCCFFVPACTCARAVGAITSILTYCPPPVRSMHNEFFPPSSVSRATCLQHLSDIKLYPTPLSHYHVQWQGQGQENKPLVRRTPHILWTSQYF
jgi:hypothetical protein